MLTKSWQINLRWIYVLSTAFWNEVLWVDKMWVSVLVELSPDSKVHGANMGPTWVLSAPDGPHVGPMKLAIWFPTVPALLCLLWYWEPLSFYSNSSQYTSHIDGIRPKGPYQSCLRMADRALLAGYPRYLVCEGSIWDVFCEYKLWFIICISHYSTCWITFWWNPTRVPMEVTKRCGLLMTWSIVQNTHANHPIAHLHGWAVGLPEYLLWVQNLVDDICVSLLMVCIIMSYRTMTWWDSTEKSYHFQGKKIRKNIYRSKVQVTFVCYGHFGCLQVLYSKWNYIYNHRTSNIRGTES